LAHSQVVVDPCDRLLIKTHSLKRKKVKMTLKLIFF